MRAALALCAVSLALAAHPAAAQWTPEMGGRLAPQYHAYSIASPSNTTVGELAIPLFAYLPITPSLSVDVGSSYAAAHVRQTNAGRAVSSDISGLTDTQVRASYIFGTDFVVLTAGVNLPTGRATATQAQQLAAGLIGSDFLAFPISNMGTGFGATGGVALARPMGAWNAGFGLSLRHSASYDPFEAAGGQALRYQPGDEYRARVGIDRAFGTGRITLGLTYSRFGNDDLAGSVYNTGDRYITNFSLDNSVHGGHLSFAGWNLFRAAGTLADSTFLAHEDVSSAVLSYGITLGRTLVEPSIEARSWLQAGAPASALATVAVRAELGSGAFAIVPSLGYSLGSVAAENAEGAFARASLTGFHATIALRAR